MKKHLLLLAFISFTQFAFSQGNPGNPGNPPPWMLCLEFNTQSQVDSFPINFPGISSVLCLTIFGPDITNVDSLIGIDSIVGDLHIGFSGTCWPPPCGNLILEDISGLSNLETVSGNLSISHNELLSDITALENINKDSLWSVNITSNPLLSLCNIESICNYISSDSAVVLIENNMAGCNSIEEVEEACESCPTSMLLSFTSQAQIDQFPSLYPACTQLPGWLWISGPDITNVDSLIQLTSVGLLDIGAFNVGNPLLENLDGLSNLTDIGGYLGLVENDILSSLEPLSNVNDFSTLIIIDNDNLTNLEGLENTITTEQFIIRSNDALENLDALENINVMNQYVSIEDNSVLSNLDGLLNVDHTSPDSLFIINNANLTTCNNTFICDFVNDFPEQAIIEENAEGCASVSEVLLSCGIGVGVDEVVNSQVSIYPNPAKDILYIASEAKIRFIHLFNALGQKMPLPNETAINVSQLPRGIYILEIEIENEIFRKRLLID